MSLQELFQTRLSQIRATKQSNCRGTALFLVGLKPNDEQIGGYQAYEQFLKELQVTEQPNEFDLAAWQKTVKGKTYVSHLGVVVGTEPKTLVTHRPFVGGLIRENEDIPTATSIQYMGCDLVYYSTRGIPVSG